MTLDWRIVVAANGQHWELLDSRLLSIVLNPKMFHHGPGKPFQLYLTITLHTLPA